FGVGGEPLFGAYVGLGGGGVGAVGGGLAKAACGGRCLYTKAGFKRGYAEAQGAHGY
ncbi:hypothetical protein MKX03_035488, partial [Papaver bracteatum]